MSKSEIKSNPVFPSLLLERLNNPKTICFTWIKRKLLIAEIDSYFNFHTYLSQCLAGIYLFKDGNGNTRPTYEICSKLAKETLEQRQWRGSGVFIVNFEQISDIVLVFPLF